MPRYNHLCSCIFNTDFGKQPFSTGEVAINLNDSKPVISEHEFIFEPGMTVKKGFLH